MFSLKDKLIALPKGPGVYLFKNKQGEIIYVGKAKSLRKRVASYFKPHPEIKTSILLNRLYDIEYIETESELKALILEDELIKKYKPRYNVSLRDDKAYPFLKLTVNEEWPRLFLVRRKEKDGALYFGRYQGGMVREVIRLVKKLFPIRWCKESPLKKREQPCLYHRIGNCGGPCVGKINQENYQGLVKGIISFLKGNMADASERLKKEMEKASIEQDFERAAYLRDRLKILDKMREGKTNLFKKPSAWELPEVAELQKILKLKSLPLRIECFDISNISGTNAVGSMVVFVAGKPLKNDYRRFKILSLADKPDDPRSIYEIVQRRYTKTLAIKLSPPDLVVVDGGIAQVNFAQKALDEAGLKYPVIGLAKKEEEIYFPGRSKSLRIDKNTPALQLLQRIRDEAHRFAITYHRKRRGKALFS